MDSEIRIPQIPYDLLGPIFQHLKSDKASLCALSLASSTFRQEAQCILFREVTGHAKRKQCLAFLRAVVASPTRLALFVHTYENREYKMDPPNKVIAQQALKTMCNLKCLSLKGVLLNDNLGILRDCTFSLERFDGGASSSDAQLFKWFLPRQNMLKHLGLNDYGEETFKLPVGSCPQLVSITGSWGMIEALLPGRKITTLSVLSDGIEIDATSVQSLAVELKNIKAFSISLAYLMGYPNMLDISVLPRHFPSLKTLELTQLSKHGDLLGLYHWPFFCETLSNLTELETLILTDTNQMIELDMESEDIEFFPFFFKKLGENLKFIDVQVDWDVYTRYTKNSKCTEAISEAEALKAWLSEPIA